ncbi:MAG: preprotein translocase subunit SecE [Thermoguttaceae bacterium]
MASISNEFSSLTKELFRVALYKPNQGKLARRFSMIGFALIFITGAFSFYRADWFSFEVRSVIAAIIAATGSWLAFRVVNWAPFADFLVSVEAEMTKVSWPSYRETYNTTVVVLVILAIFVAVLLVFDLFWRTLFQHVFQIL